MTVIQKKEPIFFYLANLSLGYMKILGVQKVQFRNSNN